jgi:uncharacterized metal-binding protein YceD (DUF177 family)
VEKSFERKYSLEVPKLGYGINEEAFEIDRSFFEEFEHSPIQEGEVKVHLVVDKSSTHLDAKFHFLGKIILECDRCLEPYPHAVDFETRIVYSFDEELEFDTDEVVLIDESTPVLYFAQDFYDFLVLQIPLRKVPPTDLHLCPPNVLELLGLNPDGSSKDLPEDEEEPVDPRWADLKKLKDSE